MIRLEALRVFVIVASEGNIRAAARRIGRTPSAVSMTLKQLEAEIGAPLFATDRKNSLTELGRFVLETARAQIAGFDRMIAAIRARAEGRVGQLAVACVPSIAATLMPGLIDGFLAERPGVELELLDADSAAVAELVESGEVDLGIAARPAPGRVLRFRPLLADGFMVICPATSPLAAGTGPLAWEALAGERLIRNGASDRLEAPACRALSAAAPLMVRNVTSLLAMVAAGLGITLLPALAVARLPEGLVGRPLADREARREVGLIERSDAPRSPAAEAFIARLEVEAAALARRLARGDPPAAQGR